MMITKSIDMNDDELRAAAEEVARALGLYVEGYVCPWCGFNPGSAVPEKSYEQDTCPRCQFFVEYETRPLDLLTDAGALRLWDTLTEKYGVHSNTIRWAATEDEEAFVIVQVSLHPKCVLKTATTWPAALVQAAHAALQAGWLEGEGSDAE